MWDQIKAITIAPPSTAGPGREPDLRQLVQRRVPAAATPFLGDAPIQWCAAPSSCDILLHMPAIFAVRVEDFEGPLDLLLQLVERRQLDITRLTLAAVAGQYLEHLEGVDRGDLEAWSAFVAIGSRLLLLKSTCLLPAPPPPEAEEDAEELVTLLAEYQRFKLAAEALRARFEAGTRSYPRPVPPAVLPQPPRLEGLSPEDLCRALQRALARRSETPVAALTRRTLTVQDCIERIRRLLSVRRYFQFTLLVAQCRTRLEIVVTFLALLELLRRGLVQARQATLFGEILVEAR